MEKILVPIDTSKHARKAVEKAKEIAEKFQSDVYILNVIPDINYISLDNKQELMEQNKKESQKLLEETKKIFDGTNVKVTIKTTIGDITGEIMEEAKNIDAGLIIMGCRGLGAFERTLLGSVSTKVVHHSPISVMIVK